MPEIKDPSSFSPIDRSVTGEKGAIHYFVAGPEDAARTVMFLHGLSSNHTTWLFFMEKLAARGIRSIAPDLRGHGLSDQSKEKEWYAFPVFVDDIARIADRERLREFDLIGYSFGGYIALAYAAAYPERLRSLTLVSSNFMNPLHYGPFGFLAPAAARFTDVIAWITYPQRRRRYDYFEHGKSKGYIDSTLKGFVTMPIAVNFWMLGRTLRLDLRAALPRVVCPTLIIRSPSDPYLTPQEVADMVRAMPNARAIAITSDNHFLASRNQEDLLEKLLPFWEDPSMFIKKP
jgi:pimeloyl-ACP methyl ester carboxylesterase